jgi:hypothetical protein
VELTKLTQKFERDLQMKTKNKEDQKQLTLKYTKEKDKFEKNMTLKRSSATWRGGTGRRRTGCTRSSTS